MNFDIVIIGGGIVGLTLANQILERDERLRIAIIDKEREIGLHTSGRNSGVLHAGIFYKPNSLKSKVCINGARRLKEWCKEEGLDLLNCGKIITPQKEHLDSQLEVLNEMGKQNGVSSEIINKQEFLKLIPYGRSASGRALFVPSTSVVKPIQILRRLEKRLREKNVQFFLGYHVSFNLKNQQILMLKNKFKKQIEDISLNYGYLFNSSGLHSDRVAKKFQIGKDLTILPFKGIYWGLSKSSPFNITTNLYPVPDMNMPFLGVHFTPTTDGKINIGPTAFPAFGRENYKNLDNLEPSLTINFLKHLTVQWIINKRGFRNYASGQALQGFKPLFLKAAQELIPSIKNEHLVISDKIGIRPQLYDIVKCQLVDDFRVEHSKNSTHVLNAISPAFTSSFALADLIINSTPSFI
ncbi:FAD-dependent oxidoreductase [bacterium]|nr:FAD-dependent oxidoreductase [bacterium]